MIEYKKIYRIFLVITLFTVGMNSIDNNYIYAQNKNIYQNELEADNQNKQKIQVRKIRQMTKQITKKQNKMKRIQIQDKTK